MKQKVCSRCEKPKRIWARGLCKSCDIAINPKKYMIEKKKVERKKKAESVNTLKKKLDNIFSLYIRLRNSDENGTVECFTSGELMHYKKSHAGHYVSRRHLSTRWDETNVQVQSVKENIFNQGNAPMFAVKLDEQFGSGTAKSLVEKSLISFKEGKDWYIEKIGYYTEIVGNLKSKLNEE
jgi:hypothetical protein